ncbi:MAG: glycoside hydrolase family 92 protein, partial [Bacteroidales bacterium]|nr:glycoside hydrolase family 92 protein [Bacteroidales bacterium]
MNGRLANGTFRPVLNPYASSHRSDDFCEGTAWQWTFFVPHDIDGLVELFGSKEEFAKKLDSLFTVSSNIQGQSVSGDISGMIGQYAHGNEPSHHIAYIYNKIGQPWKAQKYVNHILTKLYSNTPDGLCGQDDTGQMSAWYIFSAMGFYPLDPVAQIYEIGSPLFPEVSMKIGNGKIFKVIALNHSSENIYVQSAKLNGNFLNRSFITFDDIRDGGVLEFRMG